MCLSSVYELTDGVENLICKHVSGVDIQGKRITLTDVMGNEKVVTGSIQKLDMINNVILIEPQI